MKLTKLFGVAALAVSERPSSMWAKIILGSSDKDGNNSLKLG